MGRMKGKVATVEGGVRIGGYKVEGERAGDGTQEEVELNNKLGRLCEILKDDPAMLRNKDIEDVICYLDVGDIISLALRSSRVEEKQTRDEYWYLDLVKPCFVPSPEKVGRLVEIMLLCGIEELKAVDLFIIYNNFSKASFASMLLRALDSYYKRRLVDDESLHLKEKEMRAKICNLCCVLPWKLFAHVMYKSTSLSMFKYSTSDTGTNEEEKEVEIHKKAAESCDICYGKGKHSGVYGYYCSYWHSVPCGATIGPSHVLHCRDCCLVKGGPTFWGCCCGSEIANAFPCSLLWKSK